MKRIILTLAAVVLALSGAFSMVGASVAQAATVNTAIRGSADTVYWYAANGKRYVFPDAGTYFSWFSNWTNVVRVSDYELTNISLGGNVTYRPGVRLVKIVSDPKVYAVARYGVLRWVASEQVARDLYGNNWGSQVRDIPVEYFSNYTVGTTIWSASDYSVWNEQANAVMPSDSLGVTGSVLGVNTGGYAGTTGAGFTSATYMTGGVTNRSTSGNTETVTFTGTVFNPNTDASNIRIDLLDNSNNSVLRSCNGTTYCSVTIASAINTTRTFTARAYDQANRLVVASPIVVNYGGSTTGANATMSVDRTQITSGESVTLNFNLTNVSVSANRIEIRDSRNNSVVRSCFSSTACTTTTPVFATSGLASETVQFYGQAYDSNNQLIASANAPLVSIGQTTATIGSIVVNVDRTTVNGGESVFVTATAQNVNGPLTNLTVRLYNEHTGALLNTCNGTSLCNTWVTTQVGSQYTFRVYADVSNANGQTFTRGYSPTILVNGNQQTTGTLTVSADRTSVQNGEAVFFSAQAANITGSVSGLTIRLTDERTGSIVQTCSNTTVCSASVVTTGGSYTYRVYADVINTSNGQSFARAYSPIITVNGTGGGCTSNCGGTLTGTITLSASQSSVHIGQTISLSSQLSGLSVPTVDMTIKYYDSRTNTKVAECRTQNPVCSPTVTVAAGGSSVQYYAIATDMQGRTLPTAWSQTITLLP